MKINVLSYFIVAFGPNGSVLSITNVTFELELLYLMEVNVADSWFGIEVHYYEHWQDDRLIWNASEDKNVIQLESKNIWTPQFRFTGTAPVIRTIDVKDNLVNIYPNGQVIRRSLIIFMLVD